MRTINLLPGEREPTPDELQLGSVVVAEYVKWVGQEVFRIICAPGQQAAAEARVRAEWEDQRFTGPMGAFTFNDIDTALILRELSDACVQPAFVFPAQQPPSVQDA